MKKTLLLLIGLGIGLSQMNAQWIQTNGPYNNSNIHAIFAHDSTTFATTDLCGLFSKSSDENFWNLHSNIYFNTFTIKGDSLFADAQYFSGGMSRDMGVMLFDLNNPDASPIPVYSMITSQALKHTDSCLLGGNQRNGFFKLNFDGTAFDYFNVGLPTEVVWTPTSYYLQTNVTAIEISNDYILCGTNKGIYRANSDLNQWHEINEGLPLGHVTFIEEIHDTIYASIEAKLFYSDNGGDAWIQIYSAPSKITSFVKDGAELFVSTINNGVRKSIDNGINWSSMNNGLTDLSVKKIFKSDSTIKCGTSTKGIFKFQDGAWFDDNAGMVSSLIRDMTAIDNHVVALTDKNVFINSHNSFVEISPNVSRDVFLNIDNMGDTIFISDYYMQSNWPYVNQFFHYSYDHGNTWAEIGNLPYTSAGGSSEHAIYVENNRIYASSSEKMFYTDNLGLSWVDISLPSQYCNRFNAFEVINSQPFAAACNGGQLLKLDNTNGWILSNNGLPLDRPPTGLAYCDSAVFTNIELIGMYVSFDNGQHWTYASNGLNSDNKGIRDFACKGQHLFVTTANGVFVTSNYGQNWNECNDGLKNLNTSALSILKDTLYVGTYGNGIWKRAIDDINLSIGEHQDNVSNFNIFPNPAKEYFKVELPDYESFEIQVCDIMGRSIFIIPSTTNEKIDISGIQNGTYMVIVRVNDKKFIRKLIIYR
jgi:hypothetical protein